MQPQGEGSTSRPGLSNDPEILKLLQQLQQIEINQQAALAPPGHSNPG